MTGQTGKCQGFTLIELLVVVALAGILLAIAIPGYQDIVRESRRAEGISAILDTQLAQESFRANNTTYTNDFANLDVLSTTPNGYYSLALSNTAAATYTITATAQGDQAADDEDGTDCAALSIAVNGNTETRSPTACWD